MCTRRRQRRPLGPPAPRPPPSGAAQPKEGGRAEMVGHSLQRGCAPAGSEAQRASRPLPPPPSSAACTPPHQRPQVLELPQPLLHHRNFSVHVLHIPPPLLQRLLKACDVLLLALARRLCLADRRLLRRHLRVGAAAGRRSTGAEGARMGTVWRRWDGQLGARRRGIAAMTCQAVAGFGGRRSRCKTLLSGHASRCSAAHPPRSGCGSPPSSRCRLGSWAAHVAARGGE